jgi:DNA-directed RNA polymerase specialized sigma24 family protein
MPGASSAEPAEGYCSVAEAAELLGCSEQTVRNRLKTGALLGGRTRRGSRTDIHVVDRASVQTYLTEHGTSTRRTPASQRLNDLAERVRRLEDGARASNSSVDPVNLQYANLRLMAINEEYENALREALTADEHRRNALAALQKVAAGYREIAQQFHLPIGPPADA